MKTGIVVLNYNDYKTTIDFIEKVKNFKVLETIVIIDNHSTDNSFYYLEKLQSNKIEVIQTEDNKGYASGNNIGIKYLIDNFNIDNIIISNPDIILKEEDLNKLISIIEKNNIDLLAPIIKQNNELIRGWKTPNFIDDLLSNINGLGRIVKKRLCYSDDHYNNELSEVEAVSGCFFIIKSQIIKEIGYFDENTFLYYEENILGKKLQKNNKKSFICNDITVTHDLSVSIDKNFNTLNKYKILKTSQRYYQRKYNKANFIQMFLLYITYLISFFVACIIIFFRRKR